MKRPYIKPEIEVYSYTPEVGYRASVGVHVNQRDYILIQGGDRSTMRTSEDYTEYSDATGEYEMGTWDF